MRWQLKHPDPPLDKDDVIDILLDNRGVTDRQEFLDPAYPSDLSVAGVGIDGNQLTTTLKRLDQAKRHNQKVVVFGDYDADGICATAMLWQVLHQGGWEVMPFIPHRQRHGYGLTAASVEAVMTEFQPELIVTVDNGIVALEQVKQLEDQGVSVIVTDHHLPEERRGRQILPPATAVVHTTQLCGTTVAWMLAWEVSRRLLKDSDSLINDQLDLAAIATIADQVKLHDANRSFAYHGILSLRQTKRPGLLALFEQAGVDQAKLTAGQIGFGLAPRINAMGRLDDGWAALRLLCSTRPAPAHRRAALLDQTNLERQKLTQAALAAALAEADSWQDERLIVVAGRQFHLGVVGLVAGRLVEEFAKPAIVMSVDDDIIKASARSVPGVDIVELIRQVRDDLVDVGGHPMAAGFSLQPAQLERVTDRLRQLGREVISQDKLEPTIMADCPLPAGLVTQELAAQLEQLEPFGSGNPRPVFLLAGWRLSQVSTVGKDDAHLKLWLSHGQKRVSAIGWRMGELKDELGPALEQQLKVLARLELNHWNGRTRLQLVIKDLTVLG